MKTSLSPKTKQLGTALLVAMCISAFLCICITGYLSLAEHQNYLSARSQAWNMSIALTEAGIEEGLAQLNCSSTNFNGNGWQFDSGTQSYYRSNSLPDGNSYTVSVWITNSLLPVIVSRAYTTPPTLAKADGGIYFATGGLPASQPPKLTRAVKVTASRGNLFLAALVARHSIDLNGNGIVTDSYDSTDTLKSTNTKYDPAKYKGDHGDVTSNGGIYDSVNIGNGNIYGKVHISPTSPLSMVSVGSNGGVGTHAWQSSNSGEQPGYVVQDANFTFPEMALPDTQGYLSVPNNGTNIITANYWTNTTFSSPVFATNWNTAIAFAYPGSQPGLATNYYSTNTSFVPTPTPTGGVTTNYVAGNWMTNNGSPPGSGTYMPGTLSPKTSGTWTWQAIASTNFTYNLPFYTYLTLGGYTYVSYSTNYYDHILSSNNKYTTSDLNGKTYLSGPNITIVLPNGLVGDENITWSKTASLTIYAGGVSANISGNNYFNPNNGSAATFVVYMTSTVRAFDLDISGNGQMTGVLVAPTADLNLNGGGSSTMDLCGSVVCNSAKFNGHYNFHYDESLNKLNANGRYLANSWNEIN